MPKSDDILLEARALLSFKSLSPKDLMAKMKKDATLFGHILEIGCQDDSAITWRAIWCIRHCIEPNDLRIKQHSKRIINNLNSRHEGLKRESLKLLELIDWDESEESSLFDHCIIEWQNTKNKPALRITAFKIMVSIAEKYPDLFGEIEVFMHKRYYAQLSPGIQKTYFKIVKRIFKYLN